MTAVKVKACMPNTTGIRQLMIIDDSGTFTLNDVFKFIAQWVVISLCPVLIENEKKCFLNNLIQ